MLTAEDSSGGGSNSGSDDIGPDGVDQGQPAAKS